MGPPSTLHRRIEWPRAATAATEIVCGRGELASIAARLEELGLAAAGRVVVVGDPAAESAATLEVERSLAEAGLSWRRIEAASGEAHKVQPAVDRILGEAIEWGVDRGTPLVAVGGGCVGDLAAFAASVLLRGVPLVLVPTTLLAMVDASIGGKTAVNLPLPEGVLGRNLVGTFHPARLVVSDPAALATLPQREFRAGLAECVKHALLDGEPAVGFLEANAAELAAWPAAGESAVEALLARSIATKSEIVASDPLEQDRRRHLNLGHTYAHAIEALPGTPWLHGEAVSLGLVAAAAAAAEAGWLAEEAAARLGSLLASLRLPTRWPVGEVAIGRLRGLMGLDKKQRGGRLALVLLRGWGSPGVLEDPPERVVMAGWRAVGGRG